jgi:high-affinity nickel-transport protein
MFGMNFTPSTSSVKSRIAFVFGLLALGNLFAWGWALAAFHDEPILLGTAFLAYVLGLRHAVDPDHIAAIDNVTRKLMQEGQKPVSVGLWFALGHSTIVIVAAGLLAAAAAALKDRFDSFQDVGGVIGTSISAGFLILIGLFNLMVLVDVWKVFRKLRRTGRYSEDDTNALLARRGFLARILRPLFAMISKSWHMYPLGFLFALGFDTATEISLFGVSASSASNGVSVWAIMSFPLLFTAGMALADTADGVLMLGAYGWAFVKPVRKLFYNLTITFMSVFVAFVIGGIEALGLIGDRLKLEGWFWDLVAAANDQMAMLGFVIVGVFAFAWLLSALVYRVGGFDRLNAEIEA